MKTNSDQPVTPAEANDSRTASDKAVVCKELLGVGSTIWIFDRTRRVYPKPADGRILASSGPIYREHWTTAKIIGENRRSWITDRWNQKVPKKGPHQGVCFTLEEVEDDVWMSDHRYKVYEAVNRCRDVKTLRAIARIVGYETPNAPAHRPAQKT